MTVAGKSPAPLNIHKTNSFMWKFRKNPTKVQLINVLIYFLSNEKNEVEGMYIIKECEFKAKHIKVDWQRATQKQYKSKQILLNICYTGKHMPS